MRDLKREVGMSRGVAITLVPPASTPEMTVDPEQAVAEVRQHRPGFSNTKLQELTAECTLDQARKQDGFSATLSAGYGLNQQDYHLWGAYLNPLNQQRCGIQFEMPILRWSGGKAEVEAARAARRQTAIEAEMQREQFDQEVYFEALELQQMRRQVAIAAKADTVAARRFKVARNRYQIGKIEITDLFHAQREKNAAQRDYYQRLRQLWTSYYRLRGMTLYDFVEDRPLRADPSSRAAP